MSETQTTTTETKPATAATTDTKPPAEKVFTEDYVKRIRAESENHRTEAQTAKEAAIQAGKDAETKIAEATATANKRIIHAELRAAAQAAGMVDLDGLKLLDADKSGVKLGDDGEVIGAAEALAKMKEAKPYLFGTPKTGNTTTVPKPGDQVPKTAMQMTGEEWKAAKAALLRA